MSAPQSETILQIIERRLIPDEQAKKARGEVFTPLNLVRELLYGFRKSDLDAGNQVIWGVDSAGNVVDDNPNNRVGGIPLEIWRDPDTKWLDPANGIGNFPFVAFHMLDFQLKKYGTKGSKEWSDEKRREHIIEKMLYMIEIDRGNVNTTFKIMDYLAPGVKPHICCGDTTKVKSEDLQQHFGASQYDVIMGNPPFNEGGTKHHGGRGFYSKFVQFAINIVKPNGCLAFIHPPNYHRINKDDKEIKIRQFFSDNSLILLRIIPDTKKYFDAQIAVDYYVIRKINNNKRGVVLDKHNIVTYDVDLSIFDTIPNFGFKAIQTLKQLQGIHGNFNATFGTDSSNHASRKDLYTNGTFPIVHLINSDGIRILLSNRKHPYSDSPKIIINGLGVPYILDDLTGKYGVTQIPLYVLNPSNTEKIFLKSRLFQYLNWAFRIQGNNNSIFTFKILPDLNKFEFTDEDTMLEKLGLEDIKYDISKFNVPVFQNNEKIEKKDSASEE